MTQYIYLSPHLDDAILSCGAVIWNQVRNHHQVQVWTIFTADPNMDFLTPVALDLHTEWGEKEPYKARRLEDENACASLKAEFRHLDYLDCIYRVIPGSNLPLVNQDKDIFSEIHPEENSLIERILLDLRFNLPQDAVIYAPCAIGGHVDHRIIHAVAKKLDKPVSYYPDFPYSGLPENIQSFVMPDEKNQIHNEVTNEDIEHWQNAVLQYRSQVGIFWPSIEQMKHDFVAYSNTPFGNVIFKM